jgi:small GTP-binding protein
MKTIQVEVNGIPKRVKLQLWDTAGQERFKSITLNYFRGSHAAILVFALNDDDSLLKLHQWIEELDINGVKTRILIGNKSDIKHHIISTDRIRAAYPTMEYFETSAKSGENVELLFYELATKLATLKVENVIADIKDTPPTPRRLEYDEPSGNGKCC